MFFSFALLPMKKHQVSGATRQGLKRFQVQHWEKIVSTASIY
jgi:hypothetical protein